MTAELLDLGIVVLILLSTTIGLIRGFLQEALSLVTWVAAFACAILYFRTVATYLPFTDMREVVKLGIAFAIIFFGVLSLGAIVNHLISSAASSIGLGGVDHVIGGVFGVLRGGLIITLLVLLFGMTTISKNAWWKDSLLMPWFEQTAGTLQGMVPHDVEDFSKLMP